MRNPWAQTGNYRTSYVQDTTIFANYREIVSVVLLLVALCILPMFLERSQVLVLNFILIYAIAVLGLNITTGYAGLISVGQAAFMGVGAYTVALSAPNLPFWLTIPLGGLTAAIIGFIVGIPSLRVKHLYLALATLAFQEIFVWVVGRSPALAQGAAIPVEMRNFLGLEIGFRNHNYFWYYIILFVLVLMVIAWRNLLRGKYGRALIAVRDNDRAADAMGMDPGRTKLFAFALGAFLWGHSRWPAGLHAAGRGGGGVYPGPFGGAPGHGHCGRAGHRGGQPPGPGLYRVFAALHGTAFGMDEVQCLRSEHHPGGRGRGLGLVAPFLWPGHCAVPDLRAQGAL